ncbi:MAG TPA: AraC family transcriptional regulator [Flavobacterium sp.]|nr:AraC family transcriptional regulator [Flavobacterium sp.]
MATGSKGKFITVKPKDEIAARHIAYYYFHVSDDAGFTNKFYFYPNYKHAITVYEGSDVSLTGEGSRVVPANDKKISSFYSINTDKNFKVELNGAFNKIGIVFNPLGLNHFINEPLSNYFDRSISAFTYFGEDFLQICHKVFREKDNEAKGALLDAFFRLRYCGFDEPVLRKALQLILNSNGSIKVEELSDELATNRKTLLRLFRKHLCCSVEEYKKLVMFRNALNYAQKAGEDTTLTDVALYSLYYDQAHYIKHFKSVTKQSPKALLSKLTDLGSHEEVYWNFED